jgi:hypothetical protein
MVLANLRPEGQTVIGTGGNGDMLTATRAKERGKRQRTGTCAKVVAWRKL